MTRYSVCRKWTWSRMGLTDLHCLDAYDCKWLNSVTHFTMYLCFRLRSLVSSLTFTVQYILVMKRLHFVKCQMCKKNFKKDGRQQSQILTKMFLVRFRSHWRLAIALALWENMETKHYQWYPSHWILAKSTHANFC